MNFFELEQHIQGCWNVCEDIKTLEEQGADMKDMLALSTLYDYKFQKLWEIFEELLTARSLEKAAQRECKRCGKKVGDGVHTCSPKEGWSDCQENW